MQPAFGLGVLFTRDENVLERCWRQSLENFGEIQSGTSLRSIPDREIDGTTPFVVSLMVYKSSPELSSQTVRKDFAGLGVFGDASWTTLVKQFEMFPLDDQSGRDVTLVSRVSGSEKEFRGEDIGRRKDRAGRSSDA